MLNSEMKKMKKQDIVFLMALAVSMFSVIFYSFRGTGTIDESFTLTIPHRLISGDRLIIDEWHLTQFSALLQYIPMKIFVLIKGNTDGIILYFRLLYVAIKCAVTIFIYEKMKKYGAVSIVSAILFCNYCTVSINTLYYHNMGLIMTALTCLLLFCSDSLSKKRLILSGIVIAFAVLAEPMLALIYFGWLFAVVISAVKSRNNGNKSEKDTLYDIHTFLYVSAGIIVIAIPVIIAVFISPGIKEVFSYITNLLTDPEYVIPGLSEGKQNLFSLSPAVLAAQSMGVVFFALMLLAVIAAAADRKRKEHKCILFSFSAVMFVACEIYSAIHAVGNPILFYLFRHVPFFMLCAVCLILLEKREKLLVRFWLSGLIYSLLIDISSDIMFMPGGVVSAIPGCIFIYQLYGEIKTEIVKFRKKNKKKRNKSFYNRLAFRYFSLGMTVAVIAAVCVTEAFDAVLQDSKLLFENCICNSDDSADVKITYGPYKGLYTTEKTAIIYEKMKADLDVIKEQTDENDGVYIYSSICWPYLYLERDYATFSTWLVDVDFPSDDRSRLEAYYSASPHKNPEYVYIPYYRCFVGLDGHEMSRDDELSKQRAEYIDGKYNCSVLQGDGGYIIKIIGNN